jgi:hypothetical protein
MSDTIEYVCKSLSSFCDEAMEGLMVSQCSEILLVYGISFTNVAVFRVFVL